MKNQDGTWTIKANGGKREGAGRKPTGRGKVNFYITEEEKALMAEFLLIYRFAGTREKETIVHYLSLFDHEEHLEF